MPAISAMLYREAKIRATNIIFVFWDFFYPLCYLLVFGVGVSAALGTPASIPGVDYNSFFLAGVLGMASFGIASNSSWSFFMDRDNGIFYEMLTYPMSRTDYLLGKVAFNLLIALAQGMITLVLGAWLLHIRLRFDLFPILFAAIVVGTSGWFFF
jgi:ABC-type transport system involved in cytochrome c biogenesis permease component